MHVLGIGTDIIECLRIAKMIERYGERFLAAIRARGPARRLSVSKFRPPSDHDP